MALPLYLAMTREEIDSYPLPAHLAYMACHFSAYGKGLQDVPARLPEGSMLILDDRIPVWDHDPRQVAEELLQAVRRLGCGSLLLDFQRPGNHRTEEILQILSRDVVIPWAVTEHYAVGADCAVLVGAPAPNKPLRVGRWEGRELWLEVAVETVQYTVTETASTAAQLSQGPDSYPQRDDGLCCSYQVEALEDRAIVTVSRTLEDLQKLMAQAESMGFACGVGLHQQLGGWE